MKLQKKIAIVTGAGQGIGRGIAETFAREGADVVINDLHIDSRTEEVKQYVESRGGRCIVVAGDVSQRCYVERLFDETWAQLGP
ncbi:MAG: SDR family NAD(P)-dependent oxidoreductase, partial [Acidobacteriaceae bacterium]|nr:SDR family NAD(P)-dependent oxidoreductase [Acidobacteriaceae bacterium]